jgi:uncharacterized protein YegL
VVEPQGSILLVYIVADQSGSIGRTIEELNAGLVSLRDAVRESAAAANVRLSVIGFSDTAFTYLEPADLSVLDAMPVLTAQSRSSYAAAFDQLAHRITVDVPALAAQGYTVGQPAVFFLTDGRPNGDQDWRSARADLLDEPAAPAILAVGIGDPDPAVISEIATKPHYAVASAPGTDTGAAMSALLTALTQSVISSGQATASGSTGLHFDKPEAFTFAADAPTTNRPPPPAPISAPSISAPSISAPPISTPQSRPARPTPRPWIIAAVAAAVAVLAVGAIAGYILRRPSSRAQSATTITTTAPIPITPTTVSPVAESALDGLLLSADQINTAMGAAGMVPDPDTTVMIDSSAGDPDKACVVMDSGAEATVYANSGWTAMRQRVVHGNNDGLGSNQALVLFSSAHDASVFFTVSAQRWRDCTLSVWGPVSNTDGVLSAPVVTSSPPRCERALTVANNVAIDIATCGVPGSAVRIAHQIAAEIPTR